jgi:hypothetical protein
VSAASWFTMRARRLHLKIALIYIKASS